MRTLQIPFCFHPDPVGGTEVYVERLSRELANKGMAALIVAPGREDAAYIHHGLRVRRYRPAPLPRDLSELYGAGDPVSAEKMGRILEEERPDVVHLHSLSRAVSLQTVLQAKRMGCRVVLTYHTPEMSCQRGTLLRWGTEICDGRLDPFLCTACTLEGLRVPRGAAAALALVPEGISRRIERAGLSGGPWTVLRMRRLTALHQRILRTILAEVHRVVVPCRWGVDLLRGNGVPAEKIALFRHAAIGGSGKETRQGGTADSDRSGFLRVAYAGRLSPSKGVHVLIEALRAAPSLAVKLDIYGIAQGESGAVYRDRLSAIAASDPRIRFCPPVPADQIVECLREYDLLAVPSLCLETGPLVVLDAFSAGIPVVGSSWGGIAEWVREGENGVLVPGGSAPEWTRKLAWLAADPDRPARLRRGIRGLRTLEAAAEEMIRLYQGLLSRDAPHETGMG